MKRNNYHLRELPSVTLDDDRITTEFRNFVTHQLVKPLGVIKGYKQDEKVDAAIQIVSNLLLAGQRCRTVSDSRDYHQPGVTLRIPIWDALITAGYARSCTGSEVSGKVTRYYATRKFLDLFAEWELHNTITQHFDRGSVMTPNEYNLVIIRPPKNERDPETGELLTRAQRRKRPKPIPRKVAELVYEVEDNLDFINQQNLKHAWQVTVLDQKGKPRVHQPGVTLQQQHVGEFMHFKRLYTPGRWGAQQLSKKVRQTMLIDGEPIAELDFKSSVLRLLYHLVGEDAPYCDLYRPDEILPKLHKRCTTPDMLSSARTLVKQLSIISINTKTWVAAFKALEKWIDESDKPELYDLILEREGTTAKRLVQRLMKVHQPIQQHLFCNMGRILISLESTIMQNICVTLACSGQPRLIRCMTEEEQMVSLGKLVPGLSICECKGKPVLPIHDAIVVKAIDTELAEHVMIEEYRRIMGFDPVIERKS